MRILTETGAELINPDFSLGYATEETIVIAHHPAVEAVEEQWHYVVVAEYPNGGKLVKRVIDVTGVEACEAWDETEEILRWHYYTAEELAQMEEEESQPTLEDIINVLLGVEE